MITSPGGGGRACPSFEQYQNCNEQPCDVDCQVSSWSPWTVCRKVLPTAGGRSQKNVCTQTRSRAITVANLGLGATCPVLLQDRNCPCLSSGRGNGSNATGVMGRLGVNFGGVGGLLGGSSLFGPALSPTDPKMQLAAVVLGAVLFLCLCCCCCSLCCRGKRRGAATRGLNRKKVMQEEAGSDEEELLSGREEVDDLLQEEEETEDNQISQEQTGDSMEYVEAAPAGWQGAPSPFAPPDFRWPGSTTVVYQPVPTVESVYQGNGRMQYY